MVQLLRVPGRRAPLVLRLLTLVVVVQRLESCHFTRGVPVVAARLEGQILRTATASRPASAASSSSSRGTNCRHSCRWDDHGGHRSSAAAAAAPGRRGRRRGHSGYGGGGGGKSSLISSARNVGGGGGALFSPPLRCLSDRGLLSLSLSLYQQKVAPAAAKLSVCPAFCRRRRQHRTRRTRTRARMSDKSPSKQIATSVCQSVKAITRSRRGCRRT